MQCLVKCVVAGFVGMFVGVTAVANEMDTRFAQYSTLPMVNLEPSFTTDPYQEFTLDMGGIGRRPIDVRGIRLNGALLPSESRRQRLNELTIESAWPLEPGLNRIELIYRHPIDPRHDENPASFTFLVNHQPDPPQIELGERGELIVDDQARLVLGSYRSGQTDDYIDALPTAVEAGFNVVHDYKFEHARFAMTDDGLDTDAFVAEARNYLQAAEEHGLGVFLGLPRPIVDDFTTDEALADIVASLSDEPALWMWYIRDEPSANSMSTLDASRVYQLLRRLDPNRPAVILNHRIELMEQYHPFSDLLWYDEYPIIATSQELISLAPITAKLQKARQTVDGDRPVWPVFQIHDNKALPNLAHLDLPEVTDENHRPTEAEMRAQTHVGIANDSYGLIYYWGPDYWYSMKEDTPGIWASLSKVLQEVGALEDVILSEEQPPSLSIQGGHDKTLMWKRQYNGNLYVGLVNTTVHEPSQLRIEPDFNASRPDIVLGDGELEMEGDQAVVHLDEAGVIVLRYGIE